MHFRPLRLHLEKRPWTSFLGSQARELQARTMASRNFGSARAGKRWGGPRGNPMATALPFPPSLLVICSPSPSLSSILSLALALFLSAFSAISCCLVAEILIVVAGKSNLPPSRYGSMVFGCLSLCSPSRFGSMVFGCWFRCSPSHPPQILSGKLKSASDLVISSLSLSVICWFAYVFYASLRLFHLFLVLC